MKAYFGNKHSKSYVTDIGDPKQKNTILFVASA